MLRQLVQVLKPGLKYSKATLGRPLRLSLGYWIGNIANLKRAYNFQSVIISAWHSDNTQLLGIKILMIQFVFKSEAKRALLNPFYKWETENTGRP